MPRRAPSRLIALSLVAVVGLAACSEPVTHQGQQTQVLQTSDVWRQSVTPEVFTRAVAALTRGIRRLRDETSSGWIGRQDDVSGFLAQLSGGGFTAAGAAGAAEAGRAFFVRYGASLFGTGDDRLTFTESAPVAGQPTVVEGDQHLSGVPVVDGRVTITVSGGRVGSIRGRLFPWVVAVGTDPAVPKDRARTTVTRESGGRVDSLGLAILPDPAPGVLVWDALVLGPNDPSAGGAASAHYYLDAATGRVVGVRPASTTRGTTSLGASVAGLALAQAVTGTAVPITGKGPIGQDLTGTGTQLQDGTIALVDPTGAGTFGAIETYDGTGVKDENLPGQLSTSATATIADPDALAAHVYGRFVLEYYLKTFGRKSWDGKGVTLKSTANFDIVCNAYFNGEQMVYGDTGECPYDATDTDIDTAGHEITHGVTGSTAGLLYTGQSGALNESFSDYFGNVIGNAYQGTDGASLYEDGCVGITEDNPICQKDPEGRFSERFMLTGAKLTDYLYFLDPPLALKRLRFTQDNGGVHLNSAIWNNALWSVRAQLARIDGKPGNDSPRAQAFDKVVYTALTRDLSPTAGFLDARAAVEQAARELSVDPVILRVIKQVMDANKICNGCVPPARTPALPVATTAETQKTPSVSGDQVAWVDLAATSDLLGQPAFAHVGRKGALTPTNDSTTLSVGWAGASLIALQDANPPKIVRYDLAAGRGTTIATDPSDAAAVGLAGSDEGAAWIDSSAPTLDFVDPQGTVTSVHDPSQGGALSVGTGGRTVCEGTDAGEVVAWKVGSDPVLLSTPQDKVFAVSCFGDRVLAVSAKLSSETVYNGTATLYDLKTGSSTVISQHAAPFGAAASAEYVVWSETVGALGGKISESFQRFGSAAPDTDLYLFSFRTGDVYDAVPGERGQQGYPALSGSRLVWQDAVNGGDDIYTGSLPSGL